MVTKDVIILAGGLGTRLQSVLTDIPKCMAPIGGLPFLTYVFDYLINQNISKVIVSVGYRKYHIINYFGDSYKSLIIEYSIETEPLGTGGALKLASSHCNQNQVFVMNGDTYFVPDLQSMEILHFQTNADVTIAVKQMLETKRYGIVQTDMEDRILEFREKDPGSGPGLINGGIYLINRELFDNFTEQKFSLEQDVFKKSSLSLKMQASITDAFFLDMGIPEDYTRAQEILPKIITI